MKLRSPIKIIGGKGRLHRWITSHLPNNYKDYTYVEPFGGGASVLLNKDKSKVEIYGELDPTIYNVFYQLKYSSTIIDKLNDIPYSEKSFRWACRAVSNDMSTTAALARIVKSRQSRGGLGTAFAWSTRLRGGQPGDINSWCTFLETLPTIRKRLSSVILLNFDGLQAIKIFNEPNVLIYIDAPYLPSTRSVKNSYEFDMTEEQHNIMLDLLLQSHAKVLLSGYMSSMYTSKLSDWNIYKKHTKNNSGQGKKKQNRTEVLWANF